MSQNYRIMVVDDDATQNMICQYLIKSIEPELEIVLFTDPKKAFASIQESSEDSAKPTIMLLDINMPFMTGWEFLVAFEELPQDIQEQFTIYILSSSIDEQDRTKAHENRLVSDFITKPLKREDIRGFLEKD